MNLFDHAFAHVPYSVPGRVSKHIEWVRHPAAIGPYPTIITDDLLVDGMAWQYEHRPLIGWLLEGRAYGRRNYEYIPRIIDLLDLLLTHDAGLLDAYPKKARFVPFGGCWIPDEKWGMHPKGEGVCQIVSGKRFMEGHRLRHAIAERFPQVNSFGGGVFSGYITDEQRTGYLTHHPFAVVVENDRGENYFTEKIIDCFAVGTIPIYWGCPNIHEFFDARGIISFEDIKALPEILAGLFPYEHYTEAAERNLVTARKYVLPEDWIYEKVLSQL